MAKVFSTLKSINTFMVSPPAMGIATLILQLHIGNMRSTWMGSFFKGLNFSVGQAPPEPFKGTKGKVF